MYHLLRRLSIGISVLAVVACGAPTSDVRTPIIPTLTASVAVPTGTVAAPTNTAMAPTATTAPMSEAATAAPTNTEIAATATTAPTPEAATVDVDTFAYQTADGYHAFGRPDAPVVLTDYSDFF